MLLDVALGEAALFEVLLVVLFRTPEGGSRNNLGYDGPFEFSRALESFLGRSGKRLLLRGVVENHRSVLGSHVGPLAVQRGGIVVLPENCQEIVVGDLCGIIDDFNRLGMPCLVCANGFVGWVVESSSHVADGG